MTNIFTNISEKFSKEEKISLSKKYKDINILDFGRYVDKSLDENVTKFVIKESGIVGTLTEATKWNSMNSLIKELYFHSRSKDETNNETQMWLIDSIKKPSLNIAFSIKAWTDISELMSSLKETLLDYKKNIEKNIQIVWISYDPDQKTWVVKKL